MDDITRAVLARAEVARYLQGGRGVTAEEARSKVMGYLGGMRTKQRYLLYKGIKYPFYLILRHLKQVVEHIEHVRAATAAGRVIYASNHRSHIDYVIEPTILDDYGIRPPIIAAGVNMFGGALGLLNRHVSGAIPIRRDSKDPAYLITLKAYVAEVLRQRDLLVYIEGGRSYSGELKPPKTGLIHAALQARVEPLNIVPVAVSYELIVEDHVLARQGVKKRQRRFTQELAEIARYAVWYKTRVFVTFGEPIPVGDCDPESRSDVLALAHRTRDAIGRLYKVTSTSLVAAAMRPSLPRPDLEARVDELIGTLRAAGANLAVDSGAQAVEEASRPLRKRGVIAVQNGRYRVRNRQLLRYYARSIEHLLPGPPERAG